jgi:uroporphyrin-III C-methyltransferase
MTVTRMTGRPKSGACKEGFVSLVGAGPGDPDLLTVKALRVIHSADIILFDSLVSDEIQGLFPKTTPALHVGKRKSHHSIAQEDLNKLIIDKARQGLHVCRLKGGDAFVFGRGGEEMLEIKAAGVQVEVVPGITAASGCSSYAGIPLTHRGLSQGCSFITAHAEHELHIQWTALAASDHTLVFYMGLTRARMISEQLQAAGMSADTPVALIEKGCCPDQRVLLGCLEELPELGLREQVQSPALIVVGKVVGLAEELAWLEQVIPQETRLLSA